MPGASSCPQIAGKGMEACWRLDSADCNGTLERWLDKTGLYLVMWLHLGCCWSNSIGSQRWSAHYKLSQELLTLWIRCTTVRLSYDGPYQCPQTSLFDINQAIKALHQMLSSIWCSAAQRVEMETCRQPDLIIHGVGDDQIDQTINIVQQTPKWSKPSLNTPLATSLHCTIMWIVQWLDSTGIWIVQKWFSVQWSSE